LTVKSAQDNQWQKANVAKDYLSLRGDKLLMPKQNPDRKFTADFIWSYFRNHPIRLLLGLAALLISSGSLLSIPKVLGYFVDQNIINEDWSGLHLAAAIISAVITLYAATAALRPN